MGTMALGAAIAVLTGDIPMSKLSQESADSENSVSSSQFIILIIQKRLVKI